MLEKSVLRSSEVGRNCGASLRSTEGRAALSFLFGAESFLFVVLLEEEEEEGFDDEEEEEGLDEEGALFVFVFPRSLGDDEDEEDEEEDEGDFLEKLMSTISKLGVFEGEAVLLS